jgi:hypothetical protein
MMKSATHLFQILILGFALGACATDGAGDAGTSSDPATSEAESALTCTPGAEMCDFCCELSGGPSSNDCIVRCNSTGTGWVPAQDCGWAQNATYSSSCLDATPHPICKWN